ncbi:MAG TPA: flagellar hook-associated protein FlgK, partial [Gammaproteobacteria bacterium]|nr:flagellar hook-associated protein FlgK [Gammaproteobacteria bacterium]
MAVNGILSNAVSGLLASRQAMNTVSHNVANVNTAGYTRQRVELSSRNALSSNNLSVGNGVFVSRIRRIYDTALQTQIQTSGAAQQRYDSLASLASGVDNLMAESSSGMGSSLQSFFAAASSVSNNPASGTDRQLLLDSAGSLLNRAQSVYSRLTEIERGTNSRLTTAVQSINQLASNLAGVNRAISRAAASVRGTPNDLYDQRDQLILDLSKKIDLSTVLHSDGSVNVYVGKGESLVIGDKTRSLRAGKDRYDGRRLDLQLGDGVGYHSISNSIKNGEVYGILQFRSEVLDPALNGLGRVVVSLGLNFNAQHRLGQDLKGRPGGDFFAMGGPEVLPKNTNTSLATTAVPVVGYADAQALTTDNYLLNWQGATWQLMNRRTGQIVPMTGAGTTASPFLADGLSISVAGITAGVGDQYSFLIRPTAVVARDTRLAL